MIKCWDGGYKEESKGNDIGDKEKQEEGIIVAFCKFVPSIDRGREKRIKRWKEV